ncbi:MAG: glycosyltransferase family 2 protein [Bacteroidota bacterium]
MNSLVSVGIPTYNRPEGLKRSLEQISAQTYTNLEIIVSDNCSNNKEVKEIVEEFVRKDPRVKYYRQTSNIGLTLNFKFVLQKATGEYFMWASDDDEWHPTFIETCLNNIGNAGSAMQHNFKTYLRETNQTIVYDGPILSTKKSTFENIIHFHQNTQPSLIYGLYRRQTIIPFLTDKNMDIIDVFILYRHILHYGINTFPQQLYTAGINGSDYEFKPINPSKNRLFSYKPLLYRTTLEIFKCKDLSLTQKLIVSKIFFLKILGNFTTYEKKYRPGQVKIVHFVHKSLIYLNNFLCKITGSTNYYINKMDKL